MLITRSWATCRRDADRVRDLVREREIGDAISIEVARNHGERCIAKLHGRSAHEGTVATPNHQHTETIPIDLSALDPPPVACPAHSADAHGVCTMKGGESGACRYRKVTCRCAPPPAAMWQQTCDGVVHLHPHATYTWACVDNLRGDGCPTEVAEIGAPCTGSLRCTCARPNQGCQPPPTLWDDRSCSNGRWR